MPGTYGLIQWWGSAAPLPPCRHPVKCRSLDWGELVPGCCGNVSQPQNTLPGLTHSFDSRKIPPLLWRIPWLQLCGGRRAPSSTSRFYVTLSFELGRRLLCWQRGILTGPSVGLPSPALSPAPFFTLPSHQQAESESSPLSLLPNQRKL